MSAYNQFIIDLVLGKYNFVLGHQHFMDFLVSKYPSKFKDNYLRGLEDTAKVIDEKKWSHENSRDRVNLLCYNSYIDNYAPNYYSGQIREDDLCQELRRIKRDTFSSYPIFLLLDPTLNPEEVRQVAFQLFGMVIVWRSELLQLANQILITEQDLAEDLSNQLSYLSLQQEQLTEQLSPLKEEIKQRQQQTGQSLDRLKRNWTNLSQSNLNEKQLINQAKVEVNKLTSKLADSKKLLQALEVDKDKINRFYLQYHQAEDRYLREVERLKNLNQEIANQHLQFKRDLAKLQVEDLTRD